jgi:hypothetical protein
MAAVQTTGPEIPPPEFPARPAERPSERFRNLALGAAGIISSVFIPLAGLYAASRDKEKEVDKGFVEIATQILSDKPTPDNAPLRKWAIDIIDHYSAIKLAPQAKTTLELKPIFEHKPAVADAKDAAAQRTGPQGAP